MTPHDTKPAYLVSIGKSGKSLFFIKKLNLYFVFLNDEVIKKKEFETSLSTFYRAMTLQDFQRSYENIDFDWSRRLTFKSVGDRPIYHLVRYLSLPLEIRDDSVILGMTMSNTD